MPNRKLVWTPERSKKLKALWEKAKRDRRVFNELVAADSDLKRISGTTFLRGARKHLPGFEKAIPVPHVWPRFKEKIARLWEKAGRDRAMFAELIAADPDLSAIPRKTFDDGARKFLPGYRESILGAHVWIRLEEGNAKQLEALLADWRIGWDEVDRQFPGHTQAQFRHFAKMRGIRIQNWKPRTGMVKPGAADEHEPAFLFEENNWPDPEVIRIPKEEWERNGKRVVYLSRLDFEAEGYRRDLVPLAIRTAAGWPGAGGFHFPVLAGGLVHKNWIQAQIKKIWAKYPPFEREIEYEDFLKKVAHCVSSSLPIVKDPDGNTVKWYIMLSYPFDGPHAEKILGHLEKLRPDIRKGEEGGESLEVWGAHGEESVYHGVVLQKRMPGRGRIPSGVMSNFPEKEIKDIESQTSREFPGIWVVGTAATALWKPSGEREVPYLTIPAIRRLEANDKRLAENQSGFLIVEEMPDGDRLNHFWNFRDLIAHERDFITGIKSGATDFHRRIVEILKRDGACFPGRLAEELGVSREELEKQIAFLVEDKSSPRRTWAGLHHDKAKDKYSFHSDWIRRMLRYNFPSGKDGWYEDSFMNLGCLHAGYTTTDYEFVANVIPQKMLAYGVTTIAGVGDFIAGLYHHLRERGETFNMSYPEQERFAAELVATILIKVFRERFTSAWKMRSNRVAPGELSGMIEAALPFFPFIMGNHDKWQLNDSQEPLDKFYSHLLHVVRQHVSQVLTACGVPFINVEPIVKRRIQFLSPADPQTLPSGIRFAMIHPEMGRAATSNRPEKELERFVLPKYRCDVVFIANFHTAVAVHKWHPEVGQCVASQQGTAAIRTDFEVNKTKEVDFGVQMLKTLSYKGKIMRTSVASFNCPVLKKPRSKNENVDELKKKLGLCLPLE